MKIKLNGDLRKFSAVDTVVTLLDELGIERDVGGLAIAVNGSVVSKTKWPDTRLNDGDEVEIIHAVQGG